ncbi:hypothetical protein AO501_07905 [Mycobacterium gordonae]|uniref:Uncharacterized protein n=1 Tax=Mycobacterium gordonae TaxID=1778 RepID=A0A0Q2QL08_MYCGO|nr:MULTISPECIES: hypothetical protein [Mycobacterium]KQH80501.1 hypothetical protein AO501_07905 [Mycobacterium gordonae]PJE02832.1 MAG: hypothetical protein CK428_29565 [Mycobacterium sp.]
MEVYGRGPDAGREATYTGTINWSPTTEDDGRWDNYTVIQPKQCQTLMQPILTLSGRVPMGRRKRGRVHN